MQTSLRGIAEKSALRKEHRFQNLMNELTPEYLTWCWQQLNKKAAPGVDRVTVREYGKNLSENIADLRGRLRRGAYRAKTDTQTFHTEAGGKATSARSSGHRGQGVADRCSQNSRSNI